MREVTLKGGNGSVLIDGAGDGPVVLVLGLALQTAGTLSKPVCSLLQFHFLNFAYWTDLNYPPEKIEKITLNSMVDDVEGARNQLEQQSGSTGCYERVTLFGHSAYGLLAVACGEKYPKRFDAIMVGTPLPFDWKKLDELQGEYFAANFGNVRWPNAKWTAHCRARRRERPKETLKYFLGWLGCCASFICKGQWQERPKEAEPELTIESIKALFESLRLFIWETKAFWEDEGGRASRIWDPCKISVTDSEGGIHERTYDINVKMIGRFLAIITQQTDWFDRIEVSKMAALCILGRSDSRVPIEYFEQMLGGRKLPSKFRLFLAKGAHFPHWGEDAEDGDTSELDSAMVNFVYDVQEEGASFSR